jgi:hypothetical protein
MYVFKKKGIKVCINPSSRIHNTSLISCELDFGLDSRECLEYLFIDENYNKNIPPLQSGKLDITTLRRLPGGITKKGVQVKFSKACPPFTWL